MGTANYAEDRPWGRFEVIAEGEGYKAKVITVSAGQRLSLQRHNHRAEQWTVVGGTGIALVDDVEIPLAFGATVDVPIGATHRMINPSDADLVIVEVQLGTCDEDDIERLSDDYGRTPATA